MEQIEESQVHTIRPVTVDMVCGIEVGTIPARGRTYLAISENPDWYRVNGEIDRLTKTFGEPDVETVSDDGRLYYEWTGM
ncbi:hypothetical protein [Kitasatospora sp. NPDC056800]|uniref:hypothetical protein n=1 Tax=Kitasatospora sp. NPDC056800 TaxID=3345948 RepID=UPI0036AE081E